MISVRTIPINDDLAVIKWLFSLMTYPDWRHTLIDLLFFLDEIILNTLIFFLISQEKNLFGI